jgi:hypothetical protein
LRIGRRKVVRWFAEPEADDGTLTVCRMKNGFALADGEALDGYRDLKVRAALRKRARIGHSAVRKL